MCEETTEPIWFTHNLNIENVHGLDGYTLGHHLGMEWVSITANTLSIKMPVDERTKQPFGLLHGGASLALSETVGSLATFYVLDPKKYIGVGLEINANHLRAVRSGYVTGTAYPVHLGRSTHVWDVKIIDDNDRLVCISRLTVAILEHSALSGLANT